MCNKSPQKLMLLKVLTAAIEFLRRSDESIWTSLSPEMAVEKLKTGIDRLFGKSETKAAELDYLFAPTGPLQEIAMANGWHDEYIILSGEWDDLKGQMA
ncbi:MAG: hypothetical protein JW976_15410 [Syntrophaceae bacterium]|nr:hypothetical protein [Syntrophaceae bacterium]